MKIKLRSGYTTGACAAAAAKAATFLLFQKTAPPTHPSPSRGEGKEGGESLGPEIWALGSDIKIPFPDGSRVKFRIHNARFNAQENSAWASVIKDAGDDPDVTNGAEIVAEAKFQNTEHRKQETAYKNEQILSIKGGQGVGIITKPGLPLPVDEAAINLMPRKMIRDAVMEAILQNTGHRIQNTNENYLASDFWPLTSVLEITISVPEGENLARKTLNPRLGIIGGISILGTTGIVKPLSSEAWTATIASSMDVARAMGRDEIVLSAGRASEKAHMKKFNLPEESYVMMGDYLEFALLEAKKHGFKKIYLCAQWAKMLKIAMSTPQTHVRHGTIDIKKANEFLKELGRNIGIKSQGLWDICYEFNTAREVFDFINSKLKTQNSKLLSGVCSAAQKYAGGIASGIPVIAHLVSYEREIIADSE